LLDAGGWLAQYEIMRVPKRRFAIATVLMVTAVSVVGGVLGACGAGNVLRKEPNVKFMRPRGAVLFARVNGAVVRLRFNARKRVAPFVCGATEATVHTAESSTSLLYSLKLMAQQSGFTRVQLHDVDGKLLARGTFCIFPTLKTPTKSILKGYEIELPPKVMKRLRSGKAVAVFQDYAPLEGAKPGWNHLAWVLYLEHHTLY
jgi:hypothetical protein